MLLGKILNNPFSIVKMRTLVSDTESCPEYEMTRLVKIPSTY